jgi:hypothetical protein
MGSSDTAGSTAALNNANAAYAQYNQDYGNWQNQYNQYRQQADQQYAQDYGNNAADYAQKANKSGIATANQQLDQQSRGAVNQAQLAGRSAGLTKGQAAMNAANVANQTYQSGYANAVNQGADMYGQGAAARTQRNQNMMGNSLQGQGIASQGMQGAMGIQQGVGANQKSEFDKNMNIFSGIGQGITALGTAALSDEDSKKEIEPSWESDFMDRLLKLSDERIKEPTPQKDLLAEVAENINNYTYHYKPGVGEDPSVEYSGVMAQELLQIDGYRSCVFEDDDGLLKVDTSRLALVNAGMIADLSKRLLMLEEFIKAAMAGLAHGQTMPDVE